MATKGEGYPIIPGRPWLIAVNANQKWGIDAIGLLQRTSSGKEYIIMAVDYMTRWAEVAQHNNDHSHRGWQICV